MISRTDLKVVFRNRYHRSWQAIINPQWHARCRHRGDWENRLLHCQLQCNSP